MIRTDIKRAGAILLLLWLAFAYSGVLAGAEQPALQPVTEPALTEADRDYWAFRPLVRPPLPKVDVPGWCRTPIDRFILARLEKAGLTGQPAAERLTLLRRATIDLTGLPPTLEEIADFVVDTSPDAYERLLDRLLGSASYGERWAQHWLDLARFAETDGFEHDLERPHAWRYRDWVIAALNADLPYDEFVQLQLAGDLLQPDDPLALAATGFLLCGPDMPDINLQEERRHNFLNDMTGTVGAVLLGMQVGCAACHDHKYDPISQADFYRLRAIFESLELFKDHPLPGAGRQPGSTPAVGRIASEAKSPQLAGRLYVRGDFRNPGPEVEPGFLRVVASATPGHSSSASPASSEPTRVQLARWLTRPDHPLALRVIVNRIWQHHFGRGLVETPSDFGRLGADPTHPELLDWLATELPRQGWSLKQIHRLIMTSAVYLQSSRLTSNDRAADWNRALSFDAENKHYSRMPRRRLEGEALRDCLLAASGSLNTRRGGPGVRPPLPGELVKTLLPNQWNVSPDEADHRRRSIYLFVRRNLRYPLFEAFDRPDGNASCPRRSRSTIAPQALHLLNSELTLSAARDLAGLLCKDAGFDREAQIVLAFRTVLGRPPREAEQQAVDDFFETQVARLRSLARPARALAIPPGAPPDTEPADAAALVDLCVALFNLNEFLYVD